MKIPSEVSINLYSIVLIPVVLDFTERWHDFVTKFNIKFIMINLYVACRIY